MARTLAGVRLLALLWSLILLSACGGGGGPTTPSGQQLTGTLNIDIRTLAVEQNSAIIPITLAVPRTNAVDAIPVHMRIAWRRTAVIGDPKRLMTHAPGSIDLNNRDTIIDIPVEGREVTFFWDALADLGPDWNPADEITIQAGILAANANDPRQAVCDFEPIIRVGFGGSGIGCSTPIPQIDEITTPSATIGEPFSFQLETTGGEPPLAFQVIDPVTGNSTGTPDIGFGLFLNSETGLISGIATSDAPEQISFFGRVVDNCDNSNSGQRVGTQFTPAGGRFDQARITIPVEGGIAPVCDEAPAITTTGLPNAALDTPYEFQLEATGGEGTLTWTAEITPSTPDFSVDGNGLITGIPTAPDTYTIAVSVTDSCDSIQSDAAELTLVVPCGEGPSFNSPSTLPTASIDTLYDHSFNVDMPNGPGTVVFDSGTLPEGIILTPVLDELNRRVIVRLRGTPSNEEEAGQNFVFTLRASDDCPEGALSDTQGFTLPLASASACPEPTPQLTSPTGTNDLPPGTAGQPYSVTLLTSGGTAPVGPVTIVSGEPAGFLIDFDGRTLTGTLPASGPSSYDITLQIQDSCETPRTDRETFTLDVTAGCPTLGITTTALPNATNLAPYSFQLEASGGFGSQTWSLTGASESLPGGMTLGTDGLLSGTPDDASRTYNLDFEVRDTCPGGAQIETRALTLTLEDPACSLPAIEPPDVQDPTFDVPFSLQLVAASGVPPYSWEVTEGRFPTGIDIDANGLISGTPSEVSEISVPFTATVTVTDSCLDTPGTDTIDIELTVRPPGCSALVFTTPSVPNAVFSEPYSASIEAIGELPISYEIISGTLPTGITMNAGGILSGSATNPSDIGVDFPFTVQATDSCLAGAQTETATFEMTVTTTITCDPIAILNKGFPDPVVNDPYSQSLSAEGEAPFTWSLAGGSLPTGLSINASGLLEGTPTNASEAGQPFTFTIGVTDSCALAPQSTTAEFTITLRPELACNELEITTAGLPNANWSQLYSTGLTATGEPPLSWSVISGNLPTGLTLNAAGLITGIPTNASEIGQSFDFTVEVSDSCVLDPQFATGDFTIIVDGPDCDPISFGPSTVPDPSFGAAYSVPFVPVGGVAPLTWSLEPDSSLPEGISLTADGQLDGTATNASEIGTEFSFSVLVEDSCPLGVQSASQAYTITLQPESCEGLEITTAGLPDASNTEPYSFQMEATGGKDPLSWSALGLPNGLVMTTDGLIQGIPDDETGIFDVEFTVFDDCNPSQVAIVNLDLTLSNPVCPTITITTTELLNPVLGEPYSDQLEAIGGAEPYAWAVIGGGLPTGISLNADGSFSGTATDPEEVGTDFDFTVQVRDACPFGPATATATFTITLNPPAGCGLVTLETSVIEDPFYQQSYFAQLEASGGQPPYFFSLDDGGLPEGLSLSESGAITGLPTDPADIGVEFNVTVDVVDSCPFAPSNDSGTITFTVQGPSCEPIGILNTGFPDPQFNQSYNATLFGTGEGNLRWEFVGGALPTGLSVDPDGELLGTPSDIEEVGTEFNFTLQVTDECVLGAQSTTADFSFTLLPAPSCGPVVIETSELPDAEWQFSYSTALQATGGQQPYSWEIIAGELPAGLEFTGDGQISGTVTDNSLIGQTFDFTVEVADSCPFNQSTDTRELSITVTGPTCDPIGISNTGFPDPQLGQAYNATLFGTGAGELTWSLAGGGLPTGMQVDPSGAISGTPNDPFEVGTQFNFTLKVEDECVFGAQSTTANFAITLNGALSCGEVSIRGLDLPAAEWNIEYPGAQIEAEGGLPPYSFAITSGSLPTGLAMGTDGNIDGIVTDPSLIGQSFDFTVEATDSCPFNPGIGTADFTITVTGPTCAPISIDNTGFPNPQLTQAYNATLFGSGEGTLTWRLDGGSLPLGLVVNPSGSITGTPTDPEQVGFSFEFTLRVTDSCAIAPQSTTALFSVTLEPAPDCGDITVEDTELPNAFYLEDYTHALTASGGQPPYTWDIIDGNLPTGLQLNGDGKITGAPTNPEDIGQTFVLTVSATDSCPFTQGTGFGEISLFVDGPECPPIGINNTGFPNPQLGQDYDATLFGTGAGELTWSLDDGLLPTGMSVLSTGSLAGTPTNPQEVGTEFNFTLRVDDECVLGVQTAFANFSFTLNPPLSCGPVSIEQTDVPDAIFNTDYDFQLTATGGQPPYVWALIDGDLPPGLNLSTSGRITGIVTDPQYVNTEWFPAIFVEDSCAFNPGSDILNGTLDVLSNCSPVSILNTGFPNPQLGQEYSEDLLGTGGQQPYFWTMGAGELPIGMSISLDGFLEGTPTSPDQVGRSFQFQIIMRDSCPGNQQSTNRSYGFTLQAAPPCNTEPVITMDRFPDAVIGTPYSVNVVTTGGIAPRHFNLIEGSLPSGLTLSDSGLVSGTVTNPQLANTEWFPDVQVTDSCPFNPGQDNKVLPLDVFGPNCPTLSITTNSLANPFFNVPYSATINTTGGTPDFTWSIVDGGLPLGLALGQDGRITGTAVDARQIGAEFNFTVRVSDECFIPKQDFQDFSIVLQPTPTCPTLGFNNTGFSGPTYLTPYTGGALFISGGTQPYFAELVNGAFPEGMSLLPPVIGGPGWRIGGTPTNPNDIGAGFDFVIRVYDSCEFGPAEVTRSFFFIVNGPECGPPTVISDTPPFAQYSIPYSFQLQASGGRPPYTWQLAEGSLPDGLTVTTDGKITGIANNPNQINERFTYRVRAIDVCGTVGPLKTFNMTLFPPP